MKTLETDEDKVLYVRNVILQAMNTYPIVWQYCLSNDDPELMREAYKGLESFADYCVKKYFKCQ